MKLSTAIGLLALGMLAVAFILGSLAPPHQSSDEAIGMCSFVIAALLFLFVAIAGLSGGIK